MPEVVDTTAPPRDAAATSLHSRVLAAMTTGLTLPADTVMPSFETVPAGEPITAASEQSGSGETHVSYYIRGTLIATWRWRVHERDCQVTLETLTPEKYEERYNGYRNLEALHTQVLENLTGTPCTLLSTFSGPGADVWVPYYNWAPDLTNMNAANVKNAVELLYEAARNQTVWDATDLPTRVKLIADPGPGLYAGGGSWWHLITSTTPASLFAGLNAINENLGRATFSRVAAWYGERVVGRPAGT